MLNGWRALAEDIMDFLIARGVRPTPHRYAIVSYLADHGTISVDAADIRVGDAAATVGRPMLRRAIELLIREGMIEAASNGARPVYRLRALEDWGAGRVAGIHGVAVRSASNGD